MKIAIVSHSTDQLVTADSLAPIARAIEDQLYVHFAPAWQSDGCPVRLVRSLAELDPEDSPLVVFDEPDQAGVLGYHTVAPNGRPYGRAFVSVVRSLGGDLSSGPNSLSVTLSHEALEMFWDPYAGGWQDMPDGRTEEAIEVCDRVEGDSYEHHGVALSNFLLPRAFRDGDGPYDWLRVLKDPWEIRSNGYAIRRVGGPSGTVTPVFGAAYPDDKRLLKLAHGRAVACRMDRRRVSTIPVQ